MVDAFTPAEFLYEIDYKPEGLSTITGKIRVGEKWEELSSVDGVFPCCFIQNYFLRFLERDIEPKWIAKVFPTPLLLGVKELKEFVDLVEKQGPQIVWKNRPLTWMPEPLPLLKLQDRTGAFATLHMDYGPFGVLECDSFKKEMTSQEKFWEKDLLETGFIKKRVGSSHYYCPLEQVVKTLSFLLDIGWKVIDVQGKQVCRQNNHRWEIEEGENHFLLKGKIKYGEHEASLENVWGTFTRREKFLDLSPTTCALIEPLKEWDDLREAEIVKEGILVKKRHYGLLEEWIQLPSSYRQAEWKEETPSSLFEGKLYGYQQEGLSFLSFLFRSHFSGLLADEMGLGKTVQLIAFFSLIEPLITNPILIGMPNSLLFNWKKEFETFLPTCSVYVHQGEKRAKEKEFLQKQKVILTSYTLLRQDRLVFENVDFSCVILDEAQVIKNAESLSSQTVCRLKSPFRLAMTGTPIENKWEDVWAIFRFIDPEILGEKKESFILEHIRKKIRPFTLRRLKKDVLKQLPEKIEQTVWVEMDEEERVFYENFLKEKKGALVSKVSEKGIAKARFEILECILRLRQICCCPSLVSGEYPSSSSKLERIVGDLEELVANGHKVLIYSQFTHLLKRIEKEVQARHWKYAYLDGKTQNREIPITSFQEDATVQIFLISLKAGGVGLNLTSADYVFICDPWWNEAVEAQAIDRAHRVGRKEKVIARRYICSETIEEKILKLKGQKSTLASTLLDFGQEQEPLAMEELYQLLSEP